MLRKNRFHDNTERGTIIEIVGLSIEVVIIVQVSVKIFAHLKDLIESVYIVTIITRISYIPKAKETSHEAFITGNI